MNKSWLISLIQDCSAGQAQAWYDHITVYLQAHKQYPRLRSVQDKVTWFSELDSDLWATISTMSVLWYMTTSDYRIVARYLTQYHDLTTATVMRVPANMWVTDRDDVIVLHNITSWVDISRGDQRYSRNLDTDLQKLLG